MARKPAGPTPIEAFTHDEVTRTNIPTADGVGHWVEEGELEREPISYERSYDFADEREVRNEALDPQLVWRGKDQQDQGDLIVEAPPLYIQEKIDPRVLVENLRKTAATGEPEPEATLFDLFDGELDELEQIEYYQHDTAWSNRMILGDSLQAMGSLAEREKLRGKVQMIYIDPPYGISFGSNWQVSTSKMQVRDGKDAAREAEQIKAFRDTWADGIHTYLSYLRDRLRAAHDLLTPTGSIWVQIGEENVHRVRAILDEVFGSENFVSQVSFATTAGFSQMAALSRSGDYLIWYAKDASKVKVRKLLQRFDQRTGYGRVELADGGRRSLTAAERLDPSILPADARIYNPSDIGSQGAAKAPQPFELDGKVFHPSPNSHWKANYPDGMRRLAWANRIHVSPRKLSYVRFAEDYGWGPLTNSWTDTVIGGFTAEKIYVVQTTTKIIQRCMLMTTDPGDLVLDPTCGSGTTAYVAEQWGRRWITIDTSRVALALARQRLMGGRFPYYLLADSSEGRAKEAQASGKHMPPTETRGDIRRGFVYARVQHITLKSIANNPDIREGMTREEIDAAIKRHADFELLYDRPYEDKKRVRVTGPFTVESLSPYRSIDQRDPNASRSEQAGEADSMGADYVQTILENLRVAGIQNGRRKERIEFATLDEHAGTHVQAVGDREHGVDDTDQAETAASSRVAIAVGPEYGTVSAGFVRDAAREAIKDPDVDLLCVLGFAFDPNVSSTTDIDGVTLDTSDEGFASVEGERKLGRIKVLFVRMNAELLMGDALKKTGAGNLFTVFGEPDVEVRPVNIDGTEKLEVELRGVDVYDATTGAVRAADTSQVALWMIDTDYNEESFFVRHCYFTGGNDPMKKLKIALKADIDADAWAQLYRTTSMPFDRPSTGKFAIKVINDFGDEVMKVYRVEDAA